VRASLGSSEALTPIAFGRVVEFHEVATEGHLAHEVGAEVFFRPLDLPWLVGLGKGHDLPQVAVVPHELPAAQKRAAFHRHTFGVVLDLAFALLAVFAMHADHGRSHAIRLHVAKQEVMRAACDGGGDLDALGVRIRLPGIVLLRRVKDMPDELATVPGEMRDVFAGKKHDSSLIRQRLRQDEASAMGHDGGVRAQRDGLRASEMVIARWDRHDAVLDEQGDEFARVVGESSDGKKEESEQRLHAPSITAPARRTPRQRVSEMRQARFITPAHPSRSHRGCPSGGNRGLGSGK